MKLGLKMLTHTVLTEGKGAIVNRLLVTILGSMFRRTGFYKRFFFFKEKLLQRTGSCAEKAIPRH